MISSDINSYGRAYITAIQALIQITEIYLDAKAVLCKEKQHQRMHIYKKQCTLVITHWHGQCQQKFTVH